MKKYWISDSDIVFVVHLNVLLYVFMCENLKFKEIDEHFNTNYALILFTSAGNMFWWIDVHSKKNGITNGMNCGVSR